MTGPNIPVALPDCIPWVGPTNEHGYGRSTTKGIRSYAHRRSYCEYNNLNLSDIRGRTVMHKCDNPVCINPEHLVLGSQADNVKDMDRKGRRRVVAKSGEEHANCTIPDSIVEQIRLEYTGTFGEQAKLSNKYGVSRSHMNRIVNAKSR